MQPFSEKASTICEFHLYSSDLGKLGVDAVTAWPTLEESGDQNNCTLDNAKPQDAPTLAIRITYPEGSINPGNPDAPAGGYQFKVAFPNSMLAVGLSYSVYFDDDFEFQKGGKLPGLYGGTSPTGGAEGAGDEGFSARFMWRQHGDGELYGYFPACGGEEKGNKWGLSIGRGNWQFGPGKWVTLEQYIVMNDPERRDGQLYVWADGRLVISCENVQFRNNENFGVDGFYFSTFFGGNESTWASPKTQCALFRDFKIYTK